MTGRFTRETFQAFRVLPWDVDGAQIRCHYEFDDADRFTEVITLPCSVDDPDRLAPLIDLLALAAGTSYFKAAAPRQISVETGRPISLETAQVVRALYDDGLREFAFNNELEIPFRTELVAEIGAVTMPSAVSGRPLIPCGGGRDSSLLTSVLADANPYLLSIKPNPYVDQLGAHFGLEVGQARRDIDRHLLSLNDDGRAMNGHIPVTAIYSLVSCLAGVLLGCGDIVMANERSASSPSRVLPNGATVNHQYSKSEQLEGLLRAAVADGPSWYSALRPWSELAIARAVARRGDLVPLIMSCNRAFNEYNTRSSGWCRACDKCRFVYLTLAPFCPPHELAAAFGADMLADDSAANIEGFAALCRADRPFDCVGEEIEARAALTLLAQSDGWHDHVVVRVLSQQFVAATASEIAALFEPHEPHHVPPGLFASLAGALS